MVMLSIKTLLVLLLLALLAGIIIETPIATTISKFLNGVSQFFAPAANAINSTSDQALCAHYHIGC